jgi:hypothetical protein
VTVKKFGGRTNFGQANYRKKIGGHRKNKQGDKNPAEHTKTSENTDTKRREAHTKHGDNKEREKESAHKAHYQQRQETHKNREKESTIRNRK